MPCDCLVHTRYRLTVRNSGRSSVRAVLEAGSGTVRILRGRITPEAAVLDVEVCGSSEKPRNRVGARPPRDREPHRHALIVARTAGSSSVTTF